MSILRIITITAALLAGAACFFVPDAQAGSCCGGGAGVTLLLPKDAAAMIATSFELEKYNGFWNKEGDYLHDPSGTDLRQYRLNLGYALRLAPRWQASVNLPYVWNDNRYSGISSHSEGLGDAAFTLWYEAFDSIMCRWKYFDISDLKPAVYFGLGLTVPTGISPYDDEKSSFDITGRGFYRIDGNILLEQTIFPWSASLLLTYGTHIERSVNREYGEYVTPYKKKLGDRASGSLAVSYVQFIDISESRRILTYSASLNRLWEGEGTINGDRDPTTGLEKTSAGVSVMYSTLDRVWNTQLSWNHSIMMNGWGSNFVASDVYSLGVKYVFK